MVLDLINSGLYAQRLPRTLSLLSHVPLNIVHSRGWDERITWERINVE